MDQLQNKRNQIIVILNKKVQYLFYCCPTIIVRYMSKENYVTMIGSQSLQGIEAVMPPESANSSASKGQESCGGDMSED